MGKIIKVASFEEMKNASRRLQELSDSYTEIYTQLMNEANTMGSAWDGADNLAFVEQINGFTEELKTMAEKISLASQALAQQCQNYIDRQNFNIAQVKKATN